MIYPFTSKCEKPKTVSIFYLAKTHGLIWTVAHNPDVSKSLKKKTQAYIIAL